MLFAIVDIETTGGKPAEGGISEVAIVIHDGREVRHRYSTLINPQQQIPPFITTLTGISNSMVASAPRFEEVADEIYTLLHDKVFVAHNVNFDFSFLYEKLRRCNFELRSKRLCTIRLSRKIFPSLPSYSLGKLCGSLGININGRHRALGDAEATAKLFSMLMENGAASIIEKMIKPSSGEQWLPWYVSRSQLNRLPYKPGVYYFHDGAGKVIYTGKAQNIKKRVISHFMQHNAKGNRLNFLREVHNITFSVCAGELHALIMESIEIKRLWPKYNHVQKWNTPRYGLYSFDDRNGFTRLVIDKNKSSLPALYRFNNLHEGKALLRKLSAHFGFTPNWLWGDNKEEYGNSLLEHNRKVADALNALKVQLPTFSLTERGEGSKQLYLLMENGCFYGMGYIEDTPTGLEDLKSQIIRYPDNDFIRSRLFDYAERYPESVTYWNVN